MPKKQNQKEIQKFFSKMGLPTDKERSQLLERLRPEQPEPKEQIFIRIETNTSSREEDHNA